jgi:signal transduction histidine kinase
VEISVEDNGSGIPSEILLHIFEPFFSTKDSGRGTGLGLAIAQDILERHGGTIRVETEPDTGSRFRVQLPLRSSSSEATPRPAFRECPG